MFPFFDDYITLWWASLVVLHIRSVASILKTKLNSSLMPISAVPEFKVVGKNLFIYLFITYTFH
jgi:hypothetical protein